MIGLCLRLAPPAIEACCNSIMGLEGFDALPVKRRASMLAMAWAKISTTRFTAEVLQNIIEQIDEAPFAERLQMKEGLRQRLSYAVLAYWLPIIARLPGGAEVLEDVRRDLGGVVKSDLPRCFLFE